MKMACDDKYYTVTVNMWIEVYGPKSLVYSFICSFNKCLLTPVRH